jgi:glycosyltransferase involved in cell wall biosynthesis
VGRRITLIANELRGLYPAGGMGTATSFLALALARMGHAVELLIAWQSERGLDSYWERTYAEAGITLRRAIPSGERVSPMHFEIPRTVELALRDDPPDVVITTDLSAPAYSALRLRNAGLAFSETLFVVFCHGTRRWILDMSGKVFVKDLRAVLATSVLERASLELADVVVSPSSYLVGWMREQGWVLPDRTLVIPYFTRSGATGDPPPPPPRDADTPVKRVAFFGRLEDKKGIGMFIAAVNELDSALLSRVELEFIGKPTASWTPARIRTALSERARRALREVVFKTDLDQPEALAELSRAGTLTVIPSLGDNSPNTVYECLEHGIPFLASSAGGIPELVAEQDRASVLFAPTVEGTRAALAHALSAQGPPPSARPAFDAEASAAVWASVVEQRPPRRTSTDEPAAPYVVLLRDSDAADDALVPTLARAQAATGADVVTCAARVVDESGAETIHFFSGQPGGLGVLANDYGAAALVRREILADGTRASPEGDPNWPVLARLAAGGASIVSLPLPLVTCRRPPGTAETAPRDALLAVQELERALPRGASSLARLAAGLAATTSVHNGGPRRATHRWRRQARSFARKALAATRASPT